MSQIQKQALNDIRTIDVSLSNLRTRDTGDGTMQIQGYGMLFDQPSVPMPFIEYFDPHSLDNVDLSQVLLLYGHEPNQILARADSKTLTVKVDDKGLLFTATLPDTTLGHDTYNNILAGNLRGCSIGFNIADGGDSWSQDQNGNTIHTITQISELMEISITPIPAYEETSVSVQRSYSKFLKGGNSMPKGTETKESVEETRDQSSTPTDASNSNSAVQPAAIDYEKLANLVAQKIQGQASDPSQTRDDTDEPDDDQEQDDSTPKQEPVQPTTPTQSTNAKPAVSNTNSGSTSSSAPTISNDDKEKEGKPNVRSLDNNMKTDSVKAFQEFLKTGRVTRDVTGGMTLNDGQVLIPHDILTPEHEQHQFPRLGSLVRNISVKHTTGTLPVFDEETQRLARHTEYSPTTPANKPSIKQILWNLKTFTGEYVFSQDLISDSDYNWQSELQGRLTDLRDNTDDAEIATALTANITPTKADNLLDQIVSILDRNLKPQDSNNAGILLSQSAFAELDTMKDNEGRPLVQPDVTSGTGKQIKGKTVVVIDDTLFPNAKSGDINMIITPFQKAVIKFKNNEITGQFQDSYDIWYKRLGIYMRCDYVQARADLINWVTSTTGAKKAAQQPAQPTSPTQPKN